MGQTKRLYEEYHIIEVSDDIYKKELDFFEANARHLKTITKKDQQHFVGDMMHATLLSEKIKADKKLRNYKQDKLQKTD